MARSHGFGKFQQCKPRVLAEVLAISGCYALWFQKQCEDNCGLRYGPLCRPSGAPILHSAYPALPGRACAVTPFGLGKLRRILISLAGLSGPGLRCNALRAGKTS